MCLCVYVCVCVFGACVCNLGVSSMSLSEGPCVLYVFWPASVCLLCNLSPCLSVAGAAPGIEPRTSRTRSGNHTTTPSSRLECIGILNDVSKPMLKGPTRRQLHRQTIKQTGTPKRTQRTRTHTHTMMIVYYRMCFCFESLVCSPNLRAFCQIEDQLRQSLAG